MYSIIYELFVPTTPMPNATEGARGTHLPLPSSLHKSLLQVANNSILKYNTDYSILSYIIIYYHILEYTIVY